MTAIGLRRGTVRLYPHNRGWKALFNKEKVKLSFLFLYIEHVGSTSIKGIHAKPIIDIEVGIPNMGSARMFIVPLKQLGYEFREQSSKQNHYFFAKGPEAKRTHYLHLVKYNGAMWGKDLFFRDYLNAHPAAAKQYEKLKRILEKEFAPNRRSYTKGKAVFIKSVLSKIK